MKRTTRGFDAKEHCSARTYEYVTPTYAFAKDHVSLQKAVQYLKRLECEQHFDKAVCRTIIIIIMIIIIIIMLQNIIAFDCYFNFSLGNNIKV